MVSVNHRNNDQKKCKHSDKDKKHSHVLYVLYLCQASANTSDVDKFSWHTIWSKLVE